MRKEPVGEGAPVRQKLRAAGGSRRIIRAWGAIRPTQAIVGIRRTIDCAGFDYGAE